MSAARLTALVHHPNDKPHIAYGAIDDPDVAPRTSASSSSLSMRGRVLALLDTLFFTRGTRIYEISQQRARDVDDALPLAQCNTTEACVATLHAHYAAHGGSVLTALLLTHGRMLAASAFGVLLLAAIAIFAPVVLHQVVLAFSPASGIVDKPALIAWLAAFIASRLVKVVVSTQVSYCVNIAGMRIAASMRSLLFRKAMRKSLCALPTTSTGTNAPAAPAASAGAAATASKPSNSSSPVNIMNLATADVRTLQQAVLSGFDVLTLPIQIGVTTYLLYAVLGAAAFAGVSVIIVTLLLNYAISTRMSRSFAQLMRTQDERMKAVKETFGAIQVVKFNAWEPRFAHKLRSVRARELRSLAAYSYAGAASAFLSWSSSLLVSTVAFAVYALVLEQTLTAAKVFTAMALFNALRDPLRLLPDTIQLLVQSTVSIQRLDAFLQAPEYVPENVERDEGDNYSVTAAAAGGMDVSAVVSVTNASFSWTIADPAAAPDDRELLIAATLRDLTFRLERRDFAVVYGSVGAGKSSLCAALLGEMHKRAGRVAVRGRVAYYAQQPWIQHLSIRDNIVFGAPFDAARYNAVLDACCLRPDLALLPAGDATEIGEKGVNLSGGQKARVSLARACYADADIYILDSPLAAVDTVVQKAIFQQCFCGLLADKTVVLVTHNPEVIASPAVTLRLGLAGGALVECTRVGDAIPRAVLAARFAAAASAASPDVVESSTTAGDDNKKRAAAGNGVLVHAEARAEGQVARAVWRRYLHAIGGARMLALLLATQLLWQAFQILSDVWLSHWTSAAPTSHSSDDVDTFIATYAKLAAAAAVMVLVRGVVVTFMGLRASRYLFEAMTTGLLHAPLRFFDANPIGRILNRFGGDMNAVDVVTPSNISACLNAMFTVVCSVVTAVVVIRSMSLCLLPIVYLYTRVLAGYVRTFRDIRRLMGVAVSPILSHLAQSEHGVETIRAFGSDSVQRAIVENARRVDVNNVLWYTEIVMIQWFSQRMQALCVGFLTVIAASFVVFSDRFSPGLVGLVFTYALVVDASLVTLIKTWSRAENSMVNVERVLEYSALEREGPSGDETDLSLLQVAPQWPQHGAIAFEHVAFRYKPRDALVLTDVTFAIRAHEKVGIVGRTGAGKSSLTMALFRMNELARGRIVVDGVDIATLPLATLRSRLSIIPQSPVLLEGSVRAFLDPFDDYSDADVLQALAHVELLATLETYALALATTDSSSPSTSPSEAVAIAVASTDNVLALQLSASGDNLSVGERQLLCMARALLKRSTIVVMDEATAAMDHATERKLSAMIARELADVTLLTIAHRLATVMASDRIMVLQDGRVVEFGSPTELLAMAPVRDDSSSSSSRRAGVFYELVQEAKHSNDTM